MFVEIILAGGVGKRAPLRVPASQVVVYQDDGTPVVAAGVYGPEGALYVSTAWEEDFNRCLAALGVNMTVVVDTIQMPPPPPGAKLVRGPR